MTIQYLNPTSKTQKFPLQVANKLPSVKGKTIAIISSGKKGSGPFFRWLEAELLTTYEVGKIINVKKENFSAPVKSTIFETAEWDGVISGVGD